MEPRSERLEYRRPFAMGALLSFLGERSVPGLESFDGQTYRRSVAADGGDAVIGLAPDPVEPFVRLDVFMEHGHLSDSVEAVRRLLDLDTDVAAVDAALAADPAMAPLVHRLPGVRVPGASDGFELAVRAVVGQQVSVRGARTIAGRIVARFGTSLELPVGEVTHRFPRAERLAEADLRGLGMPDGRAETIRRLAELVASGELDLSGSAEVAATVRLLDAVPGIGPWTCSYVAMRALRDPDAFPAADLGVRRGFERLGLPASAAAIRDHAERWRPWRAYAAMRLWTG